MKVLNKVNYDKKGMALKCSREKTERENVHLNNHTFSLSDGDS